MAKEKAVIRTDMTRFRWTLLEMKKHKSVRLPTPYHFHSQ